MIDQSICIHVFFLSYFFSFTGSISSESSHVSSPVTNHISPVSTPKRVAMGTSLGPPTGTPPVVTIAPTKTVNGFWRSEGRQVWQSLPYYISSRPVLPNPGPVEPPPHGMLLIVLLSDTHLRSWVFTNELMSWVRCVWLGRRLKCAVLGSSRSRIGIHWSSVRKKL